MNPGIITISTGTATQKELDMICAKFPVSRLIATDYGSQCMKFQAESEWFDPVAEGEEVPEYWIKLQTLPRRGKSVIVGVERVDKPAVADKIPAEPLPDILGYDTDKEWDMSERLSMARGDLKLPIGKGLIFTSDGVLKDPLLEKIRKRKELLEQRRSENNHRLKVHFDKMAVLKNQKQYIHLCAVTREYQAQCDYRIEQLEAEFEAKYGKSV